MVHVPISFQALPPLKLTLAESRYLMVEGLYLPGISILAINFSIVKANTFEPFMAMCMGQKANLVLANILEDAHSLAKVVGVLLQDLSDM